MNMRSIALAIFAFSLILFAYSLYPYQDELMKDTQIYLQTGEKMELYIFGYGGHILVSLHGIYGKMLNNVKIYLDNKEISSGKWCSLNGIGNHTLSFYSSQNESAYLSVFTKGTNIIIPAGFGAISILSGVYFYTGRKKHNI